MSRPRPPAGPLAKIAFLAALALCVWSLQVPAGAGMRHRAEVGRASLVGQVLRADGIPLVGARIRLIRIVDSAVYVSGPANRDGEFRLDRLPGGRYAVHVLWADTRQVYPWIPDLEIGSDVALRRVLRIRPPLPEPYPGDAAWKDWTATVGSGTEGS